MAGDKKISELDSASTLDGTEFLVVNQSGVTYKKILSGFLTYISTFFTGSSNIVMTGIITTGTWNAKFKPRSVKVTTATTTTTPNSDTTDIHSLTAQATALVIASPSGSPVDGQGLDIRVHDNGSSQTVTFGLAYRFSSDLPNPGATTPGKTIYYRFKYNDIVSKWDCISILDNF